MADVNPANWVDDYGDYLFRYAKSRLRDPGAAEEVVQETFLAGVRYSRQYSGSGSERGWLMGILKRKIVDHIRARAKHNQELVYEDEHDPSEQLFDAAGNWKPGAINWSPPPDQEIEMQELQFVVQGCLETLPENQAAVFVLSAMEEMDTDEVCRELDITPSNMWVRIHRARVGLAKCVSAKWQVDQNIGTNEVKQHAK
ncbi:sigma-70 family RNA polymerase sigma factor [Planctomycetes bacterium K23_9]|uniref:RNA polymerase sigma factor SigM n=1 Tax=Stieleria marina TaxID=1930275 RepID=A0A517NUP2_9BACT|nr:RNA polymerase sigma factor SigM [Planctomycetes bacterium K23_9]